MSPLVTVLVIMLLTVVYNESQFVTDYQDVYQKVFKKKSYPLEFCQRKRCQNLHFRWSESNVRNFDKEEEIIKNHELMNEAIMERFAQKRYDVSKRYKSYNNFCATVKSPVDKPGYFPNMLFNITCEHTSAFQGGQQICQSGSNCQPVIHHARVLARRFDTDTIDYDMPRELQDCWKFEIIELHVGCKCARY